MTRDEIATMISGIGLPFAYDHFKEDQPHPKGPPYICFIYTDDSDLMADNVNYARVTGLMIELYTDDPRFDLEAAVEMALTENELPFAKDGPNYIQSERMYQTTYDTEVLLNV